MDMQTAIRTVTERRDLDAGQMTAVMRLIMGGDATPAQIGGFLIGLRMKGETVEEIAAAAAVMRELATHVTVDHPHLVDIVGTGGDGVGTFNVSTASAMVVAAAGGRVAKHGNRSISSSSGSADLLEQAGVRLDLTPDQVAACVDEVGVGFMFAPRHHGAMRHAVAPRREMAVRTIFNVLGPLTNPAGAPNLLIGVYAAEWVEPLARVMQRLGAEHVLVVHSDDGLDEISIGAPTRVAELKGGGAGQRHRGTQRRSRALCRGACGDPRGGHRARTRGARVRAGAGQAGAARRVHPGPAARRGVSDGRRHPGRPRADPRAQG